jgi:4-amino-4-deoxy-L-arabinose transferase-like glycosyltransferase
MWLVGPLLVLSASSGKLPTYTLPLFPPLALLLALGLRRAHEAGAISLGAPERWARRLLLAAAATAALFAATGTAWTPVPALWTSHGAVRWSLVAAALVAWAALDRWSWRARGAEHWLVRTAAAPAIALACVPFLFPDAVVRGPRHPWTVLQRGHEALTSADRVIATSPLAHAVIWQTRRRDVLVTGWPGEYDGGMQPQEDLDRLVPTERLVETIRATLASGQARSVALVSPERDSAADAAATLPPPQLRLEHEGVLVLVWRSP